MKDEPVYLTPKEIAKQLRVSHATVLRWIRAGKLPALHLGGGSYRVEKKDYDTFLKEGKKQ